MREDLIERLRAMAESDMVPMDRAMQLMLEAAAALEAAREALDREAALKGGVEHQRDALWAELEAAREDAERYRWLRDRHDRTHQDWHVRDPWNNAPAIGDLDAAIDQARGKGIVPEQGEGDRG